MIRPTQCSSKRKKGFICTLFVFTGKFKFKSFLYVHQSSNMARTSCRNKLELVFYLSLLLEWRHSFWCFGYLLTLEELVPCLPHLRHGVSRLVTGMWSLIDLPVYVRDGGWREVVLETKWKKEMMMKIKSMGGFRRI
ncbi:PREDICTED: uncharacterized protein LOC109235230 [Nicotiana attenuata]|uniref:uncharacterized protein LOC109235230 n=1 Tax=Nicotiana attenuata TaxID=49451 RepID=UPI000904D8A5|nr:PREDICTED: uncharacterized protein LOC109235230 [Nicotiana attenuata]